MPLLVYSVLRLALFGACWVALLWAGFVNAWVAAVVAALAAWGLSYVALPGPRDAAARWLAEQDARRKGVPQLSARARRDAADEDALVEAQDDPALPGESVGVPTEGAGTDQSAPEGVQPEASAPGHAEPDESSSDGVRFHVSSPEGVGPDESAPDAARPDADRRA